MTIPATMSRIPRDLEGGGTLPEEEVRGDEGEDQLDLAHRPHVGGVLKGHRGEPADRANHPRHPDERGDPPSAEHPGQLAGLRTRIQTAITAVWNTTTQARVNPACIRNPSPPRESAAAR